MPHKNPAWTLAVGAALVVIADQFSKAVILRTKIPVTKNAGVAFGLPAPEVLLYLLVGIILVVGAWVWRKKSAEVRARYALPVGLIAGGALSNIVDRVLRGGVVDFIDLKVWPAFNLADTAIVIGSLLLVWYAWRTSPKNTSHVQPGGRSAFRNRKNT